MVRRKRVGDGIVGYGDDILLNRRSIVGLTMSLCSGLAAILNAKFLPAAITMNARHITNRILALTATIDIAASP